MNHLFLSVILAGLSAQLLKIILFRFKHKKITLSDFLVTGGMPSSHAALVTSLVTSIYLEESLSTPFVISLVLAIIVLRDAFGVRRTVGEEGLILNKIIKKLKIKTKIHYSWGHTPLQVLIGSLIGFLSGLGVHYFL